LLSQNAHVVDVDPTTLTVGFASEGPRDSFMRGGNDEVLRQTAIDVVGMDWRIDTIVDPGGARGDAPVVRQPSVSPPSSPDPGPAQPAASSPPAHSADDDVDPDDADAEHAALDSE